MKKDYSGGVEQKGCKIFLFFVKPMWITYEYSTNLEVKLQCPLPLVAFEVLDGEGQSCAADRDRAHSTRLSRFQVPDFSVLDHKLVNDIHHLVNLK